MRRVGHVTFGLLSSFHVPSIFEEVIRIRWIKHLPLPVVLSRVELLHHWRLLGS